jgi:hypothetical protein
VVIAMFKALRRLALALLVLAPGTAWSQFAIGPGPQPPLVFKFNTNSGLVGALGSNVSGTQNTAFGVGAAAAVTGSGYTAFGYNACNAATTGPLGGTTCIGRTAGSKDDGTTGNVYVGDQAGLNVTSGAEGVYIGRQAGINVTTGGSNTIIGLNSLTAVTTGGSNTAVGQDVMKFAGTTSGSNTAFGASALKNPTGSYRYWTAIGATVGDGWRGSGDARNVGIGTNALAGDGSTSTFQDSIGIGVNAGAALTTGRGIYIGTSAGVYQKSASGTYIGFVAGQNHAGTGVGKNVVIGDSAFSGASNTSTASLMVIIGDGAGAAINGGASGSVLIGQGAGSGITNGNNNVMIGPSAGSTTTIGTDNIIIATRGATTGSAGIGNTLRLQGNSSSAALLCTGTNTTTPSCAFAGSVTTPRVSASGTAPALTSCGTSPTISGGDMAGTVTMGTGAPTGCVITFAVAYSSAPHCVVTWRATPLATQSYAVSTTEITLTQVATSSNVVDYVCMQ